MKLKIYLLQQQLNQPSAQSIKLIPWNKTWNKDDNWNHFYSWLETTQIHLTSLKNLMGDVENFNVQVLIQFEGKNWLDRMVSVETLLEQQTPKQYKGNQSIVCSLPECSNAWQLPALWICKACTLCTNIIFLKSLFSLWSKDVTRSNTAFPCLLMPPSKSVELKA